jgi:hypothetical protein
LAQDTDIPQGSSHLYDYIGINTLDRPTCRLIFFAK